MGHLLKSVNPEAVERIENPGFDAPDVGVMVVYRARRGVMRMGRTEFPAIVLGHDDEGFLDLFVLMEPEDMMLESHVRPFVEGNEDHGHCWRPVEDEVGEIDRNLEEAEGTITTMSLEIAGLKEGLEAQAEQIRELKALLLGDYKPAKLSVYDLLAEFEKKLKAKSKG